LRVAGRHSQRTVARHRGNGPNVGTSLGGRHRKPHPQAVARIAGGFGVGFELRGAKSFVTLAQGAPDLIGSATSRARDGDQRGPGNPGPHHAIAFAIISAEKLMSKRPGLMLMTLVTVGAVLIFASPGHAIECSRGTQKVNGQMIFTPYCQDEYLSEVAREYGFTAPAAKLRNNPNFKKEICRFVFQDIRVQITCMQAGIPEYRR
jgi:hypothetical protein